MRVSDKSVQTSENAVRYTHVETGSNKVCFMFSGSGYNYDKPLFYYATMLMLQHKIDCVHVHYSYEEDFLKKGYEGMADLMMEDVNPVINDVLKDRQYDEMIFLGKSLGTIPIAYDLMKREDFVSSKMILLTPLLKFEGMVDTVLTSEHKGLLVIGDKDPSYKEEQLQQLRHSRLEIEVIHDANHSLSVGEFETIYSIKALSNVMTKLEEVIK
ncbi:alpha/beta family hydrolase [Priestia taiwanensis]|uniref:KANL3/Tex30 alpha/beta hydrolase-like domain-containing protein n=1 Tax=Priestia taiwanensis TaxID=1347902 RepID=A0A917AKQ6_9BACI|nr:alpha/beta family hydrolase [Priestia taiwanensis]MBM7362088.1 hypothetical protein [Priestia taiwanensis]GGE59359.1 hypothetical protein GCM10007140_07110 [Priestia taiwanensis]